MKEPGYTGVSRGQRTHLLRELYEQGEVWPRTVKLAWQASPFGLTTRGLVRFVQSVTSGSAVTETSQWPLRDCTAWVLPPREPSAVVGYYFQSGAIEYVDPVNGADGGVNDGSAAKPWKTLQKAVTRKDVNDRVLVIARKGDYNEGGEPWQDVTNRVNVTSPAAIRVIAEEDPDETFITGAAD